MTPEDLAITLIIAVVTVGASYVIARHFYVKDQKQKRKQQRRMTASVKKQGDPFTLKLDPNKPNLGLTEQKVKNLGFAWILQKLFLDDNKDDAI